MNRWIIRAISIVLVAGLVAMVLPGVREWRVASACADGGGVYDYGARVCRTDGGPVTSQSMRLLSRPDGGSLMLGAFVALAMLRLFVTLDRRARARGG